MPSSSLSKGEGEVQPERVEENKIINKKKEKFFLEIGHTK